MPHIIDADGLWHFMNNYKDLKLDNTKIILTPNKNEFERLFNKVFKIEEDKDKDKKEDKGSSGHKSEEEKNEQNDYKIFEDELGPGIYSVSLSEGFDFFKKEIQLSRKLNQIILRKVTLSSYF